MADEKGPTAWDKKFVENYDTFIFDCDGVLWRGGEKIKGAAEAVSKLMEIGKRVFFVTNNSTKSRKQYVKKIQGHGIPVKDSTQILSSAFAAASYLKSINFRHKAMVVGHEGIGLELEEHQINYVNVSELLGGKQLQVSELLKAPIDPDVGAVVVGMDLTFTYSKSALASLHIQRNREKNGCFLLSTNQDSTFPSEGGRFLPGAGASVAHLEAACNMKAKNVGKPEPFMFQYLTRTFPDIKLEKALMVGDRMNTDIRFGNSGGVHTLLVLTGVTSEKMLAEQNVAEETPKYFLGSVSEIIGS